MSTCLNFLQKSINSTRWRHTNTKYFQKNNKHKVNLKARYTYINKMTNSVQTALLHSNNNNNNYKSINGLNLKICEGSACPNACATCANHDTSTCVKQYPWGKYYLKKKKKKTSVASKFNCPTFLQLDSLLIYS